jgi:hypothetical protein
MRGPASPVIGPIRGICSAHESCFLCSAFTPPFRLSALGIKHRQTSMNNAQVKIVHALYLQRYVNGCELFSVYGEIASDIWSVPHFSNTCGASHLVPRLWSIRYHIFPSWRPEDLVTRTRVASLMWARADDVRPPKRFRENDPVRQWWRINMGRTQTLEDSPRTDPCSCNVVSHNSLVAGFTGRKC